MDSLTNDLAQVLPYLLLLASYLALSFHAELTNKRVFALASLTLLVLFAGLREPFTPDMERYRGMFESPGLLSPLIIEPSFILISKGLKALGFDYHALYLTYTVITLGFVYAAINKLTEHVRLALLIYVSIPACFLNLFVEMRQVSAVAIAFYATSILLTSDTRHRLLKVLAWAILSVLFHYSALLYWLVLLCSYKFAQTSYPPVLHVAAICASLLIPTSALMAGFSFLMSPFLPAKMQAYVNMFAQSRSSLAEAGQLLKSAVYVVMGIFFVLRLRRHEHGLRFRILVNFFVVGVIILNLTRDFAEVSRVAYFFLIYQIILFPEILDEVRQRVWSLLAGYLIVLFYLAQFLWGLFYFSEETNSYMFLHYQNAFYWLFR